MLICESFINVKLFYMVGSLPLLCVLINRTKKLREK